MQPNFSFTIYNLIYFRLQRYGKSSVNLLIKIRIVLPNQRNLAKTAEGYFKPEEWSDQEGVKHNRVVLVATKFYETPDKEEAPKEEKKTSKKKAK